MNVVSRCAALLLAAACAAVAAVPCAPGDRPAPASFVSAAAAGDSVETSVRASCPCGCTERAPVRSGGSAGWALASARPAAASPIAHVGLVLPARALPEELLRAPDPVPI